MLIREFQQSLQNNDLDTARKLIAQAKNLHYPIILIDHMEASMNGSKSTDDEENALGQLLAQNELPQISISNYLLYRDDLKFLGYDQKKAETHLIEHGISELIKEEESRPQVRRYFDLNETDQQDFALLVIRSKPLEDKEVLVNGTDGISVFHANLADLTVYIHEREETVDLQDFAAWLYLRKKIPYLCILDQSDRPLDGWKTALISSAKSDQDIIFSEEYVVSKADPRCFRRNRQYKSAPSLFRIFTRGYVSGIFAVKTQLLCQLETRKDFYQSTWCLQVDILQQSNRLPLLINRPLLVRNQAINHAILEFGDHNLRHHARPIHDGYFQLSKTNMIAMNALRSEFPALIGQGDEGQIVFQPNEGMNSLVVSIIIPFRDKVDLLEQCIKSLIKNEKVISFEIILADNGSVDADTNRYVQVLMKDYPGRIVHVYIDEPFNYSRINNLASLHASGELILLLNNDIEFLGPNPLAQMAAYFAFESVGAVGASLHYPDGAIQHAGIVITPSATYDTYSPYKGTRDEEYDSFFINLKSADEWSAATAACLLVRKEDWLHLGGLDEDLTVAYNDVDFCLRLQKEGKRVLSVPGLQINHYESKSRGEDMLGEKYNRLHKEAWTLRSKHKQYFSVPDPYWSKNLTISNPRPWALSNDKPNLIQQICDTGIYNRLDGWRAPSHSHTCIYVGFDAYSRLRPDVIEQIRALADFYNIIYVTSSHQNILKDPRFADLQQSTFRVLIRRNLGYDFGSWRAGILDGSELLPQSETLLLMNDSLYGPIMPIDKMIEETIENPADIVCMTRNLVGGEHAQSYFVSYKKSVVHSPLFQTFWKTLPVFDCKFRLIQECEINWSKALLGAGYKINALYDSGNYGNQTHIDWKKLIQEQGYPFIKNELLLRNPVGQDIQEMAAFLRLNPDLFEKMKGFWAEIGVSPCFQDASL